MKLQNTISFHRFFYIILPSVEQISEIGMMQEFQKKQWNLAILYR